MKPQTAPTPRPTSATSPIAPATPNGPFIVVAATTAPRLTIAPIARLMPPVSIRMAWAIDTSASGSQLCANLETPLTLARPGKR